MCMGKRGRVLIVGLGVSRPHASPNLQRGQYKSGGGERRRAIAPAPDGRSGDGDRLGIGPTERNWTKSTWERRDERPSS